MKKLPVLATVQAAYRFVFAHLGGIIGLIWLPMVLITVVGFFVMQRYYAIAADAFASNTYGRMGPVMLSVLCYMIAKLLFTAVMCVPVVQLALGQRKEVGLVHFAFGPPEWRLFRSLLGLAAFLIVPVVILGVLVNFMVGLLSGAPALLTSAAPALLLLILVGITYIGLRFAFLLPAVATVEEGPALTRSWLLSAGNGWRILAVLLLAVGPVALAGAVAETLLEGASASLMPNFSNSTAMAAAQLHAMSVNMPISQVVGFLIAPLTLGLGCGAATAAYLALRDGAQLPPDQA